MGETVVARGKPEGGTNVPKLLRSMAIVVSLAGTAWAETDNQIVPGERVGPVALGMSLDEVAKVMGKPRRTRLERISIVYDYKQSGTCGIVRVTFGLPPGAEATKIEATGSGCATDKGIRVGSSGAEVVRAYGRGGAGYGVFRNEDKTTIVDDKTLGLGFVLSPTDQVTEISVRRPRK